MQPKPFAAGLALALAVAAPLCARAQQSPISVRGCTILSYSASSPNQLFYIQSGPPSQSNRTYSDGLKLSYVNTSAKVASRVAFSVRYGGQTERVIDTGTISPGVTITKTFGDQFSGRAYLGATPEICRAVAVRYADGTVWRESSTPAP
jgi:hypothetical protein